MRIGLFGGTFDPVHLGHLRAAENARASVGLDRVFLVPASHPPHRTRAVSSTLDRFVMVALAVAGHPCFVASDIEMQREGPSYTIDTVTSLERDCPGDQVVLVLGSDAFAEIGTWHDAARLLERVEVAVVPRPGQAGAADLSRLPAGARGARVVQGTALDVSSTEIRSLARGEHSIRYLVPDGVEDYITKRGLYR